MSNGQPESERRVKDRVELNRSVQLKFGKFQDFLTEIAGNISPTGMFVHSDSPEEAGEQFEFECALVDGFPLVSGRAEVVWVRQTSSADEPSGMGVRFLELMDNSEALIRRIVDERIKTGEQTFDLEAEGSKIRPVAEEAAPDRGLPDEILAATEKLVEDLREFTPTEEPVNDLSVDAIREAAPVAESKPPPAAAPPEDVEVEWLEPTEPAEPAKPQEPAEILEPIELLGEPEAEPSAPAVSKTPPTKDPKKPTAPLPVRLPDVLREQTPPLSDSIGQVPGADVHAVRPRLGRRLGLGRFLELVVFSLLAGLCMVLLFNQFWVRPRVDGLEARLEELTGSSRIGGPPGIRRAESAKPTEEEAEGEPGAETEDVVASTPARAGESPQDVVQKWADAWSKGRVDDYLSSYSADFVPASGASRTEWEKRRRERLVSSGSIRVAVVSLSVQEASPIETLITFTQSYQSDTFRDRVRKTLRLTLENGEWRIVEELVVRQLPW